MYEGPRHRRPTWDRPRPSSPEWRPGRTVSTERAKQIVRDHYAREHSSIEQQSPEAVADAISRAAQSWWKK